MGFKDKRCWILAGMAVVVIQGGDDAYEPRRADKVGAEQLNREAYLYVRQSTLHQVVGEHREHGSGSTLCASARWLSAGAR